MVDRNVSAQRQQHRKRIGQQVQRTQAVDFFNILTGPELLAVTEAHQPQYRERTYPPTVTLSMFMRQALDADGSCQKAVNGWAAQLTREGLKLPSTNTGAYCQARARVPVQMVRELVGESGRLLCAQASALWGWQGRCVKLVDGTCISMPDTQDNQAQYPQSRRQKPGVGFPLARLTAIVCLSSGAVLQAAMGPCIGPGTGEMDLFRTLLGSLQAGDVLLADALYSDYFTVATLQAMGVDFLFEQNGARRTDFRRGQSLGHRDHLVCWQKTERPDWMSLEQYQSFPQQVRVREVSKEGRTLVSSMLEPKTVCKQGLFELYGYRWHVELDLRNIKTTLGMQVLRCRTPEMVEKEVQVNLLAYNLIRLLMAQAAQQAGVAARQLSFKHALQLWLQWPAGLLHADPQQRCIFLRLLAQPRVGNRPNRVEPRVVKRRPKQDHPYLNVPRTVARNKIRRRTRAAAA